MRETRTGFGTVILIVFAAIILLGGGAYIVLEKNTATDRGSEERMDTEKDTGMTEEEAPKKDDKDNTASKDSMDGADTETSFSSVVLAGSESLLLDFSKMDYEKALSSKKIVVLYFYANWCPICKAEFPKMQSAFNGFSDADIIGFRVNFNDNETDQYEKDLARQFGVAYQHTKVILKNGERVLKSPESWEENRYISEINAIAVN
ncbi:MAG: hypothetical protein COU47_03330 [Candidatus Niyogibacteria bacterium CG10_big_fil_rev_8_21_14_0_10_46_36]|uniref:Thioredoxin domain-containing protein n=1 Tax=Candidatus Niyogibacteria bacterium CG10_big_fil_rev_8_21_14_0_10_46_36 TaxID=1974726 RepID=A0A2H0TCU3_9BACT|nr:MAG: hypothetical protein COU47_03330 [Candidatus Niyogibacteria bacterium CG10_big_fil_rev_8_21_14_0_10_46_36]